MLNAGWYSLAGLLVAVAATLSGPQPARGEPLLPLEGCEALATLVFARCDVEIVSRCARYPAGWRVYDRFRDGALINRSIREDGVFGRFFLDSDFTQELEYPPGMFGRLLAAGEGAQREHEYTVRKTTATSSEETTGRQIVRHDGMEKMRFFGATVDVIRLSAHSWRDDGREDIWTRVVDIERRIILEFEQTISVPDRPTRHIGATVLWRLLPGDTGFGEVRDFQGQTCGSIS